MNERNDWNNFLQSIPEISWIAIVIGFAIGAVPGLALLALRIMQESARKPTSFEQFEQYKRERSNWEDRKVDKIRYTSDNRYYTGQNSGYTMKSSSFAAGDVPAPSSVEDVPELGAGRVSMGNAQNGATPSSYSAPVRKTSSSQRRKTSSSSSSGSRKLKNGIRKFPYKPIRNGRGRMITGGILAAIFSLGIAGVIGDWGLNPNYFKYLLQDLIPMLMFWGAGVGTFLWGWFRGKRGKKFKQYLARMDNEPLIPLRPLAESLPASMDEVCQTVQQMIDDGIFGDRAYIDIGAETLVIDASVAKPDPGVRVQKEKEQDKEKDVLDFTAEDQILRQIRDANDRIPGEEISKKIARIEEITRHILTYLNKHPERASELHTFLDYYLPTTLKMLNTYAELDAQRTGGENIEVTKRRIEGILDKVVEGFELQLDKLFEGDMLDISADIDVMEQMLRRDGLSGDTKLRNRTFDARAQQGYTPTLTLDPNNTGSAVQTKPEDE